MVRRIIVATIVLTLLVGLIFYSQLRESSNHVSGTIEADEIRVGSRIGGRVKDVLVDEGDRVELGQKLIELEPYDLVQREQEAVKTLAAKEANLERLQSGLRPEEVAQAEQRFEQFRARYDLLLAGPRREEVEAARARLRVAQSEFELAKQDYERSQRLIQSNAISQSEFDDSFEKFQSSQAAVEVNQQELAILELGSRDEEIREAKARMAEAEQAWQLAREGYRAEEVKQAVAEKDAAQAALDVIREQKKELTIFSPVEGYIEALDLQKGDLVAAGAPVFSIMDVRRKWVRAYVPQNRVGIQVGQKLRVTVDSFPDDDFRGEVTYISRQAEFTPNNVQTPEERSKQVFRIKVDLPSEATQLRPGMTADVWLTPLDDTP